MAFRGLLKRARNEADRGSCRPALVSLLRATRAFAKDNVQRGMSDGEKKEFAQSFGEAYYALMPCLRSYIQREAVVAEEETATERRFKQLDIDEPRAHRTEDWRSELIDPTETRFRMLDIDERRARPVEEEENATARRFRVLDLDGVRPRRRR